ncbi:hypothetical protein [Vibrio gigantis]|uniref:hypothetical protein n=1 Tax=Vibrio gigantis TaxID=296199 RepID=UPI001BFDD397|nr:hypothetical protein [Vibrio gigantis]
MLIDVIYNDKLYLQCEEEKLLDSGIPQNVVQAAKLKMEHDKILLLRQTAYRAESDPLYMEWQFDQTAESENTWRDKVSEIKNRYPLPESHVEAA